ncbi:MAG: GtrA family protein [Thermoplasmata archaeon]
MVVEGTDDRSTPLEAEAPIRRYLRYAGAWVAGALPAFAVITALWLDPSRFNGPAEIALGGFALMFPLTVRELGVRRRPSFIYFLLGAGIAFAIVSILTGAGNGLTDEPYTTPRFVSVLLAHHDPYTYPLIFNYQQYGQTLHSESVYLYLPLLMFLQFPGVDYKWFALTMWALMVLVVRNRFDLGVWLAQPYFALMAASGYNDFPVLLLLTLAFVGFGTQRQKWAEYLALGCKQFANAIVLAYYILRRDWKNTLITAAVSLAFVVPFVLWSGPTILCPSVLADRLPVCVSGGAPTYLLNYSLWIVWTVALFYGAAAHELRTVAGREWLARILRRTRVSVEELLRLPKFAVVGLSGVFVSLSVLALILRWAGNSSTGMLLAGLAAFLVTTVWTFGWNRRWAFEGLTRRPAWFHLALYLPIQAIALALGLLVVLGSVALGRSEVTALIVAFLLGTVVSYGLNRGWNFRGPLPAVAV